MLGRWKKFLGVFLAFAMVIAMMPGTALRVSATEESEISSVTITALPEIVAGGTIAEANVTVEVPEGATAETKWEVWGTVEGEDEDSYEDWVEVTADTFSTTDVYRCFVVFTAQEGYCFSEECVVNGPEEWEPVTELNEGTSFEIEIGEYTLTRVIDRVEVTACEVAEDCEVSASEIVCYSGEETVDDGVVIEEVWSDETTDPVTNFESDKEYQLEIKLEAKSGYSFAKTVEVEIDDEQIVNVTVCPCHISFSKSYSLLPVDQVDQFEIELPVVKAGEPVFSEDYEWDDTDYTVSLTWIDEEGQEVEDATFVAGKTYILQLLYQLNNGAVLADGFTFYINDESYDEYGEGIELGEDRKWAQLEITYVVKEEITPKITITALPEFKEGGAIADANVKLEVTGVTGGSVKAETQWQVWEEEEYVVTEGTFSNTKVYRCSVLITAEGDYCFSEDYDVDYPEGMMIGGWGLEKDEDGNYTIIEIEIGEYTKTKVIDKVEVTASEVKAENTASVDEIVYWSGEEQVAGAQLKSWKWCEESEEESVDVFESDKNYQLNLELEAKEGYSFANDAELYVNGKEAGSFFYPCHVEAFASFSTLPPVEHVEITDFPEVKEDEPVFTDVTMDCDCEDCELLVEWYDEEGEDIADETFVAGNTYTLQLEYNNSSGATLSDDFVFIIDGEEYEPTKLSAETGQAWLEFIYVIGKDVTVTAISRTLIDDETVADITVKVDDDTYTCEKQLPIGSEVTVSVTDENFINWLNKNGKIVTEKTDYDFIVTGDVELTMSKKGTVGTSALVEFVSAYDQVMKSRIYTGSDNIVLPAGPSKMGYTFTGWSLTEDEIHEKITAGETHITVKPEYVQDKSKTYTVTVWVNGEVDDEQTATNLLPGSTKTVNAPNVEGKVFQQWEDEQRTILGYGSSYSMQVSKDVVIKAVYGDTSVEAEPVIAMTNVFTTDLNGKKKISFSVTRDVPDGYEVVEHGMLYNKSGMSPTPTDSTFVIDGEGVSKYEYGTTDPKGVFTLNVDVTGNTDQMVTARGYMIVKDAEGRMEICYSELVCDSYDNVAD